MDTRSRARLVNRLADAFEANLDTLYKLETLNNGRPINETRAQLSRACRTSSATPRASPWRGGMR